MADKVALNNSPTVETGWLCPLYAFRCYTSGVQIANGIKIIEAPPELCQYISQQTEHLYGLWENPSNFEFAIYIPHPEHDVSNLASNLSEDEKRLQQITRALNEQDKVQGSLSDLTTVMRLGHVGYMHIGPLVSCHHHSTTWSIGGTTIWTSVSEKNFVIEDPKYYLGISNLKLIKSLLSKVQDLRKNHTLDSLQTTLTRFHSSYTGPIENRIIDQMIAFESLFLGGSGESTYKLAMRVAFLLGKGNERKSIFEDVENAYKARSKIVHGNEPPNRRALGPIVLKMGTYLRQSIKKFIVLLSDGKTLKNIKNDLLDEYILER